MSIEDFLEEASRAEPAIQNVMLRAALACAVEHMTYQMKFAHERELQMVVETNRVAAIVRRDVP